MTALLLSRIQQLPPSVITKIAAGEVIERPASVVKEVLENAVDAGSSRIDVDIDQGGVELIRVVDNGSGILAEDLPLAFASHATSKLASADDLFRIGTLGFRGEALASIGGVAQATLQSRPADHLHGAEITCHGGELSPVRVWNGAPGTRIEIRNLFFNTPVRRKFLRTTSTEMGHIDETFTRLALAQPALHLTLRHNGKDVYKVPATASLLERIGLFFGAELRDRLFAVESRQGPATLRGYIADPACDRGNAKMQYLFLNGRWIRDRSLGHALQEAYRGLLMTGRYAVAFLFIELPADHVDVNVHPTKAEVRFREANAVYHLVLSALRERLRAENLTPRLRMTPVLAGPEGAPQFVSSFNPRSWSLSAPPPSAPYLPFASARPPAKPAAGPAEPPAFQAPPEDGAPTTAVAACSQLASDQGLAEDCGPTAPVGYVLDESQETPATEPVPEPEPLKAIQLYDAYLVAETPEGMLVIDQHALHERILFEHLKERMRTGTLEKQRMLIPEPVDLSAEQAACALEHKADLAELGLEIDDFGGGTLLLTSYPAMLGQRPPQETLKTVVDHLVIKERVPSREQLLNNLLSLMACHAAVRAGDRLTPEEIDALLAQRQLASDTHHCPHGRPTALLFSRSDLDRQFRRT